MTTALAATKRPPFAYAMLASVLFAAAIGPIFIRYGQQAGMPSLLIIALRLTIASVVLAPGILQKHRTELTHLNRKIWARLLLAGVLFAINLLMLFYALEYTSVLVTGILRRTSPLWVIGLEIVLLKAVFSRRVWFGLALTLAGSVIVGVDGLTAGAFEGRAAIGAMLALTGAVSMGVYLLLGRSLRNTLPALLYSWLVFVIAATLTLGAVLITGVPILGYTPVAYGWMLLITFVTQFVGHIPINYALHYFPATYLSIIMQAAVITSGVLAFFWFGELPNTLQIVGSIVITAGIIMASVRTK